MPKKPSSRTVSNAAVLDLIETCRSLGLLNALDLSKIDIDASKIQDPAGRCPEYSLIALWQQIAAIKEPAGIGLIIGTRINPSAKGLLASWVSQSATIREALQIFTAHIPLMNPSEHWRIQENTAVCTLDLELTGHSGYPDIAIERSLSAMVAWGEVLSGRSFPILEARLSFSAPAYADRFVPVFGENVRFDAAKNQLKFDRHFLDLPVLSSNSFLKSMVADKALQMLDSLGRNATTSDKVEAIVRKGLEAGHCDTVEQVSSRLAMSRQTLHRKLKREGTDFTSIVDELRKNQAIAWLNEGKRSISNISLCLGYSDSSSFYKAFQRWTGQSPGDYLQGNRN